MATWNDWITAANTIGGDFPFHYSRPAAETYRKIKEMGLETVIWKKFDPKNSREIRIMIREAGMFVLNHRPCLFIYDPISPFNGFSKGFLFDVTDPEQIFDWVNKNREILSSYSFLVTSQITNPGDGFVGGIFSDGLGRLLCETYHRAGVCNQRELSQGKGTNKDTGFFVTDIYPEKGNPDLEASNGRFLDYSTIRDIIRTFEVHKGYFEFIKGVQSKIPGIFVTGWEPVKFPYDAHEKLTRDESYRAHALLQKMKF
jgi:hypothetical protein